MTRAICLRIERDGRTRKALADTVRRGGLAVKNWNSFCAAHSSLVGTRRGSFVRCDVLGGVGRLMVGKYGLEVYKEGFAVGWGGGGKEQPFGGMSRLVTLFSDIVTRRPISTRERVAACIWPISPRRVYPEFSPCVIIKVMYATLDDYGVWLFNVVRKTNESTTTTIARRPSPALYFSKQSLRRSISSLVPAHRVHMHH